MPTRCPSRAEPSPSAICCRSRGCAPLAAGPCLTCCSRLPRRARIPKCGVMASTTLLARPSITVSDFRCSAAPGDKPFVEQHGCHSISYVRKGSFGYHSRGRSHELVAGAFLIGLPGPEFTSTHDLVSGDQSLSSFLP